MSWVPVSRSLGQCQAGAMGKRTHHLEEELETEKDRRNSLDKSSRGRTGDREGQKWFTLAWVKVQLIVSVYKLGKCGPVYMPLCTWNTAKYQYCI